MLSARGGPERQSLKTSLCYTTLQTYVRVPPIASISLATRNAVRSLVACKRSTRG